MILCIISARVGVYSVLYHFSGGYNPAGIILYHWSYSNIRALFHPVLLGMGDTMHLLYFYLRWYNGLSNGE